MRANLKRFWFPALLALAVALGFLLPVGSEQATAVLNRLTSLGIIIIFLLQGLMIPTESLTRGLRNWPLHLTCQASLFLLGPCLFFMAALLGSFFLPEAITTGFLFLGLLPTTISSCVVLVSRARGDVPGEIGRAHV